MDRRISPFQGLGERDALWTQGVALGSCDVSCQVPRFGHTSASPASWCLSHTSEVCCPRGGADVGWADPSLEWIAAVGRAPVRARPLRGGHKVILRPSQLHGAASALAHPTRPAIVCAIGVGFRPRLRSVWAPASTERVAWSPAGVPPLRSPPFVAPYSAKGRQFDKIVPW